MFRLEPMAEAEYRTWRAASQRAYADEKVKAGNWEAEEAEALSAEAFEKLLPGWPSRRSRSGRTSMVAPG